MRRGWQPELIAAGALACLYGALMAGHMQSIDGLLVYRQGASLAYQQSLQLHPSIWWGQTYTTSKYGLGLSLLYLPGLVLFAFLRSHLPIQTGHQFDFGLLYQDPLYTVAAAPVNMLVTAASAYLVARLLRELGFSRGVALAGLALYGVASPAIVFARGDWSQPLLGLCWVAGILAAVRARSELNRIAAWGAGAAVLAAVLTRPIEGSFLVPVLILVSAGPRFWRWGRREYVVAGIISGSYALAVLLTLLIDWGRFGSPFISGYGNEGWTTPLTVGLPGALLSPGRGILWEFPAALLAPLGVRALWRMRQQTVGAALAGLALLQLVNTATWVIWWGGATWGLRLFVPALPLVAVLAAIGARELPLGARLPVTAVLALGGIAWAIPCVLVDLFSGYTVIAGDSASNFHLAAYPPFGAWQFLHHWRALSPLDSSAVDILWLRIARQTHNLSLIAVAALAGGAAVLGMEARRWLLLPEA